MLSNLVKEYAKADFRWGFADPTVYVNVVMLFVFQSLTRQRSVSLEILTVLGAGPIACYILKQLAANDPARHYWIVVLCTAEIYGG